MTRFEELDWQATERGEVSLRRRYDPVARAEVFEVRLGEEYLMSSLFTAAERELATLALARVDGSDLQVLVGGLGLGYTAHSALADPRVARLTVVDAMAPVLNWHHRELLPETTGLAEDPRCRLVHDDFFRIMQDEPAHEYDAILLDIDHSPQHVLHPSHAPFYSESGLGALVGHLTPGGVFALWSDDPPDEAFRAVLAGALTETAAEVITFPNPLTGGDASNTIYLGRKPPAASTGG